MPNNVHSMVLSVIRVGMTHAVWQPLDPHQPADLCSGQQKQEQLMLDLGQKVGAGDVGWGEGHMAGPDIMHRVCVIQ